jgi:SAM-dependent methyltransferase
MMAEAGIFFSYSLTKCRESLLVAHVVDTARSAVKRRGWRVLDPMIEPGVGTIKEKVERALRDADACIVEVTTSVPNVMFETGFSRSLGLPIVFLVDPTSFSQSQLEAYFEFIGVDRRNPLATDLGGAEYLEYPGQLGDQDAWNAFGRKLEGVLERVGQELVPESRLLRRSCGRILVGALRTLDHNPKGHPLMRFLGGWHQLLADAFEKGGDAVFQIDSGYYQSCLKAFGDESRRQVRAVADLTDETERFWDSNPDPLETSVRERIFLTDWRSFFDDGMLTELTKLLDRQRARYEVRVGHTDKPWNGQRHPLGDAGAGQHLLLMEPDLVGGYVKEGAARHVRVERSAAKYAEAGHRYRELRDATVLFQRGWSPLELRRHWLDEHAIGAWKPEWDGMRGPGPDYYGQYDRHIRCWIPDYERLVKHCADLTTGELAARMRETDRPLTVLEIGYGTGALTRYLLEWIRHLNRPLEGLGARIVERYLGVDRSDVMQTITMSRLANRGVDARFCTGTAPGDWPPGARRYDVVCGSLVFHDMVGGGRLPDVLRAFKDVLASRGRLVFLDVFFDEEPHRARGLSFWKRWMQEFGLRDSEIDAFFSGNQDMLNSVSATELRDAARAAGFDSPEFRSVPGIRQESPFRVAVLRKQVQPTAPAS